jgi:hypothetical protein
MLTACILTTGATRLFKSIHEATDAMNRLAIVREFLEFLRERKKWWIAPIVAFLVLLGGLLIVTKGSALAPFIYTLF